MANRTYLIYSKENFTEGQFEHATRIPQLWQELYDENILKAQEPKIMDALQDRLNEEAVVDSSLVVPIGDAIANLEAKINSAADERNDKKQLRIDFLNFLKKEVRTGSNLVILLEEISWFYQKPEDFFKELKKFHTDEKTKLDYKNEAVSFDTIGTNGDFSKHSGVYRELEEALARECKIRTEQYEKADQAEKKKKAKANKLDLYFMSAVIIILIAAGIYGIFAKQDWKTGLLALGCAAVVGAYVYFKHFQKESVS